MTIDITSKSNTKDSINESSNLESSNNINKRNTSNEEEELNNELNNNKDKQSSNSTNKSINQQSKTSSLNPPIIKRRRNNSSQHFNKVYSHYNKCFQNYYHSRNFLKSNPKYIPNIKPSVNHWQLRNLLKYNYKNQSLFYTKNDCIYSYNLKNNSSERKVKLNYYPRCFDNYNDLLVTGGLLTSSSKLFSLNLENLNQSTTTNNSRRNISKGLFSIYNPENLSIHTVKIGEMINNDVKINKLSNLQYQSYLCNNDSNLYILDINNNSNLKLISKFNCELNTCLNSSLKIPNSNLITCVGDSSSIFLIDPKQGSNPVVKTINSKHEGGFDISYHPNGLIFSTVFQDGVCQLYDLRNLSSPLKTFNSTRMGHQSGAFRVCKISKQNQFNDILIISEHVGRIHLIDLKTFEKQIIVIPAALDQFGNYKESLVKKDNEEEKCEEEQEEDNEIDFKQHYPIKIYSDDVSFTSPIVYDYDYLTHVNNKLFKDLTYKPPINQTTTNKQSRESTPPKLNNPNWSNSSTSTSSSPERYNDESLFSMSPTSTSQSNPTSIYHNNHQFNSLRSSSSISYDVDIDSQLNEIYQTYSHTRSDLSRISSSNIRNSISSSLGTTTNSNYESVPLSNSSSSSSNSYNYYTNYCDDSYQQQTNHINGEMEISGIEFLQEPTTNNLKLIISCQDAGILEWEINDVCRRSIGSFEFV
ncbi:uncharacterized protein KGF55_005129 [Candida pseudojiufengensis]|uniref:uncharacterized protein n=1 Tax=Candida pseudojiufengensis TaxID=497109 RepID=UPI0022246CB7|nr:uncharacterized protein KGF55_005129 [Candida pseudojiufengensis]KAI5959897.1 hypothetical protein KGF55_005129 [Candida pseudojiufengensis]